MLTLVQDSLTDSNGSNFICRKGHTYNNLHETFYLMARVSYAEKDMYNNMNLFTFYEEDSDYELSK